MDLEPKQLRFNCILLHFVADRAAGVKGAADRDNGGLRDIIHPQTSASGWGPTQSSRRPNLPKLGRGFCTGDNNNQRENTVCISTYTHTHTQPTLRWAGKPL